MKAVTILLMYVLTSNVVQGENLRAGIASKLTSEGTRCTFGGCGDDKYCHKLNPVVGECRWKSTQGQECNYDKTNFEHKVPCQEDLVCVGDGLFTNGICKQRAEVGSSCDGHFECKSSICSDGKCTAKKAEGTVCNENSDCTTELWCLGLYRTAWDDLWDLDATQKGQCGKSESLVEGAKCSDSNYRRKECKPGLHCNGPQGTCVKNVPEGSLCTHPDACGGYPLICVGGEDGRGTCRRGYTLNEGDACSSNSNCGYLDCGRKAAGTEDLVCCSGTVTYAGYDYCTNMKEGTACWSDSMCAGICKGNAGGFSKGTCMDLKESWSSCSSNSDCKSDDCSRTTRDGTYKCCPNGYYYCWPTTSGDCKSSYYYCKGTMGH